MRRRERNERETERAVWGSGPPPFRDGLLDLLPSKLCLLLLGLLEWDSVLPDKHPLRLPRLRPSAHQNVPRRL